MKCIQENNPQDLSSTQISTDTTPAAGDGFILRQGEKIEVEATQISARALKGTAILTASAVGTAATPDAET